MALNNNKCFVGRNSSYNTEKYKMSKRKNSFYNNEEYAYSKQEKEMNEKFMSSMKQFFNSSFEDNIIIIPPEFNSFFNNFSKYNTKEEALSDCEIILRTSLKEKYPNLEEEIFEDTVEKIMIRAKRIITAYWNN